VVAEGVETEGQLTQLKALGCEYAQGFLFSRPLDARAAEQLLEEHESSRLDASALDWPAVIVARDI
jgi:EAL domain-containing protein (putative c-di-GMP-specific phosphodiesterase class I)